MTSYLHHLISTKGTLQVTLTADLVKKRIHSVIVQSGPYVIKEDTYGAMIKRARPHIIIGTNEETPQVNNRHHLHPFRQKSIHDDANQQH